MEVIMYYVIYKYMQRMHIIIKFLVDDRSILKVKHIIGKYITQTSHMHLIFIILMIN